MSTIDNSQSHQQNPFEEPSSNITQHYENQAYPLSMEAGLTARQNTPLSRLSQETSNSEVQVYSQYYKSRASHQNGDKYSYAIQNKVEVDQSLRFQLKNMNQTLIDLKRYCNVLEKRNEELAVSLQKQKLRSTHFENALNILRKGQQKIDKRVEEQSQILASLNQELQNQKSHNTALIHKLESSQAENNYLRELILLANNNYEILDQKYTSSVQKVKKIQEQSCTKQKEMTYSFHEMKNLLTNLITTPNITNLMTHNLSFGEQDENCLKKSPIFSGKSQKKADEIYRQIFMKTLKGRK